MGISRTLRNINKKIEKSISCFLAVYGEKKKMKDKRRKREYESIQLTESQNKEIQDFYKKYYGRKIDTRWHKMYQSFTGNYDYRYFPEILFSSKLETKLSDKTIASIFTDKSMVELLYKDIDGLYIPKTVVLCCSGIFYDTNRNIISKDDAIKKLYNCGQKIIKKTIDSSSGRGVLLINVKNGKDIKNNLELDQLLEQFGLNFIVQEVINNSEDILESYMINH